jgi:hypothetical protein
MDLKNYIDIKNLINLDKLAYEFYSICYILVGYHIGFTASKFLDSSDPVNIGEARILEQCGNYRKYYIKTDKDNVGFQIIKEYFDNNMWCPIIKTMDELIYRHVDVDKSGHTILPIDKLDIVRRNYLQNFITTNRHIFIELVQFRLYNIYNIRLDNNIDNYLLSHMTYIPISKRIIKYNDYGLSHNQPSLDRQKINDKKQTKSYRYYIIPD